MIKGKIVRRIEQYYPHLPQKDAINNFFNFYYYSCGMSSSEIIKYLLKGTTHSSLIHLAKRAGIELEGKGGNFYKYPYNISCECGKREILDLLIKNKELHKNIKIPCTRCEVGYLK